jgi:hypothetical protein
MLLKVIVDETDQIVAVSHLHQHLPVEAPPPGYESPPTALILGPGHREFDIAIPFDPAVRQALSHRALRARQEGVIRYRKLAGMNERADEAHPLDQPVSEDPIYQIRR